MSVPFIFKNEGLFSIYDVRATCVLRSVKIGTNRIINSTIQAGGFSVADEIPSGDEHTATCGVEENMGTTEADVAIGLEFKTGPFRWPGVRCYEILLASSGRWHKETCGKAVSQEVRNQLKELSRHR